MYKIYFEDKPFASVSDIETACALALSVHRSSNEPHCVKVIAPGGVPTDITFSLIPKEP